MVLKLKCLILEKVYGLCFMVWIEHGCNVIWCYPQQTGYVSPFEFEQIIMVLLVNFSILFCWWLGENYMWQRLNMKKQRIFRIFKHVVQDENRLLSSNPKIRQQPIYFHMEGANLKSLDSERNRAKPIWP